MSEEIKTFGDFRHYIYSVKSKRADFMESSTCGRTEIELSVIINRKYFYIEYNRGNYKIFNRGEDLLCESDNPNDIIKKIEELTNGN